MRFIAVLLLAVLVACSPVHRPEPYVWNTTYTQHEMEPKTNTLFIPTWIDQDFGENRALIQSALEDWNTVLNGKYRFMVQTREMKFEEDDVVLVVRRVSHKVALEKTGGALGWWDPREDQYVNIVDDDPVLPLHMLKTVTMHEIFHWWHMPHLKVPGTIEWPSVNRQPPCLDMYSVITIAMLKGWDPQYLNWCTP